MLTAAHVVASAMSVRVRFEADRPGERVLEAEVRFEHPPTDVAVLAVPLDEVPVVRFGRVGERDAVLRCSAMGFPAFKMRDGEDGRPYRDAEHVHGTCAVLSNRREGTLDLSVPPPDGSWDGMSGAAVFSGGRIVGIVAAHHHADGAGRLAVSRADRWAERLSDGERCAFERELSTSLAHLPDVLPPSRLGQIEAGYQVLLRDIAPPDLYGRDEELRELVDFCAGPDTYRWIQGRPWSGKTALVSWFALHPPRGVVPVSFFITSRLAGQADSTAYTEALVHQLAAIVGREPSPHASPVVRETERRALLAEAAERVAEDGATLLLVVDGLDEDRSARDGATGPSIASLLPERPPPNLRVLVASRPNPGLPLDVGPGHPLHHCPPSELGSTHYAEHLEHKARYELNKVLAGGEHLEKDIVGLIAAARGSLRPEDLRELTGRELYAVRHRVDGVFGRILRRRGRSARPDEERGFLFAHETLFIAATEMLGPDLLPYLDRIHAWSAGYRERGWPPETPPYVLHGYPRMVAALGDLERATRLATDPRRQDRIREETGSDSAALAEIDSVAAAVERAAPDDPGLLAALAAAGVLLAHRNSALPPNLPPVLARLGQLRRAEGLAWSVYDPLERGQALAGVAQVLAERGDERAVGLAREADRLVRDRSGGWRAMADVAAAREITKIVAVVLAGLGRTAEALDAADQVGNWNGHAAEALGRVSLAVRPYDPQLAAEVADRARRALTELITDDWDSDRAGQIRAFGAVASAFVPLDPAQAARFFDRIESLAEDERAAHLPVTTAYAAAELRTARPRSALHIGRLAAARAAARLAQLGDALSPKAELRTGIVTALADLGLIAEATELAGAWQRVDGNSWRSLVCRARDHAATGDWGTAERVAALIDEPKEAAETWAALAERALLGPDR
ncbi:PE-PGRS family protein, partial [Streptomyces himastatinicus ATCC 53653]